ncbi:hypothetical protein M231_05681 [Tremella mesenterica]|uniref:Uncharacterized protein n=1 Tax=Tremella mesenterica TaxID=5217 RepID=A0A4Q1BHK8_TREME|nr:hypothetical protein M231_05681 [Tremella mesenterica]
MRLPIFSGRQMKREVCPGQVISRCFFDIFAAGPSHTHVVVDPSTSTDIRQHVHALTASELLSTASPRCFSTFSSALDGLIERSLTGSFSENGNADGEGRRLAKRGRHHGAISPGMVVEISGPPGGGKTVLSIALVLSARIGALETSAAPSGQFGQTKGEVLIIDTEGSITPERLLHAAQAAVRASEISPVSILDGIHLIRVATQVQMVALLHTLDEWLDSHPATELVVFDTLSFHFRHPGLDLGVKRRLMELAKQEIARASTMHGCAVVVNNQLATKLLTAENKPANFDTGDRAVLMPQLGDLSPSFIRDTAESCR